MPPRRWHRRPVSPDSVTRPWWPPCRTHCCGPQRPARSPWPIFSGRRTAPGLLVLAHSKTDQQGRGRHALSRAADHAAPRRLPEGGGAVGEGALFRRMRRGWHGHTVPAFPQEYPEHHSRPRGRRRAPGPAQRPQPPGGRRPVTDRARGHATGGAAGRTLAVPIHGGALRRRASGRTRRGSQAQVRYTRGRSCPTRPDHIDARAAALHPPAPSLAGRYRAIVVDPPWKPGQDRPMLCPAESYGRAWTTPRSAHTNCAHCPESTGHTPPHSFLWLWATNGKVRLRRGLPPKIGALPMRITRVRIHNFRGIRSLDVRLGNN